MKNVNKNQARWDTMSTTGRLEIIYKDPSMRHPRWQNLAKDMAGRNWDQLTSLQVEAINSLMLAHFRYSGD